MNSKCESYAKAIKNAVLPTFYPVFFKEGKQMSKDGFTYSNLNFGKTDAFIRAYEFENASLNQAYENLNSILKKNENIKIRSILPKMNAQDTLKFQASIKDENDGHTCYIWKNDKELWIQSTPQRNEVFIFVLKQEDKSTKLYYYEKKLEIDFRITILSFYMKIKVMMKWLV